LGVPAEFSQSSPPLLKDRNKSDRIDARKLAERLRINYHKPVYYGEHGLRMLTELSRSYLAISKRGNMTC